MRYEIADLHKAAMNFYKAARIEIAKFMGEDDELSDEFMTIELDFLTPMHQFDPISNMVIHDVEDTPKE